MPWISRVLAVAVLAGVGEHALAQAETVATRRQVAASASGDGVSDSGFEQDEGLGNFSSVRTACVTAPSGASGCGVGTQESQVQHDGVHAVGQAGASTTTGAFDLGGSFGRSSFEARVRVDAAVRYRLSGSVRAGGALALATLFGPGGAVIRQHTESIGESSFDETGLLPPGVYELHAVAEASADPSTESGGTAGDFDVAFSWACAADFNADGFVDFFDYVGFVACFETGDCPSGSSPDFNGDDFVDFFDYDAFVGAFERGC